MTEPQAITPDHLRDLLAAAPDAFLGLVEGEVRVVGGQDDEGALEVLSATDLRERVGDDPSQDDLVSEAAALTAAHQGLGG